MLTDQGQDPLKPEVTQEEVQTTSFSSEKKLVNTVNQPKNFKIL